MKIDLDKYSIKARLYPSFIVLLPAFVLSLYYITNLEQYYHYFTALISVGLFTYVLAQLGRDQGKLKEPKLFLKWGGKPTSQILRHSNEYLDENTKTRYHKLLSRKIGAINIPTLEEELGDLKKADGIYDSCAKYVISKTRDTSKFPLLFKELTSYGFRRNLWGMKAIAVFILFICATIHAFILTSGFKLFPIPNTKEASLLIFLLLLVLFWFAIVTKAWIKIPAFAYAERLYETLGEIA
ncbi:MAG: hypothetical protein KA239_00305 [Bacteroidia bacterium]|nr:hypothetical protein [Bacteroidia bacterium]